MQAVDRRRFSEALTVVAEALGESLTPMRIDAYFAALNDLDIAPVEDALRRLMSMSRFFPKPVEIRDLVLGSVEDRALAAWSQLDEAALKCGDDSLYCSDAILGRAMLDTFHGWIEAYEFLTHSSPEMLASKRKEFIGHYTRLLRLDFKGDQRLFAGRSEINNRESLPRWRDRWIEEGRPTFSSTMVRIEGGEVQRVPVLFEVETGQLTETSRLALYATAAQGQLKD